MQLYSAEYSLYYNREICIINSLNNKLKSVGKRLKACRKQTGLSQRAIAENVNLSRAYISKIEHGSQTPLLPVFIKLLNVFGISADFVLADVLDCADASFKINNPDFRMYHLTDSQIEAIYGVIDSMLEK